MSETAIEVTESGVSIIGLEVRNRDVAQYLGSTPVDEREPTLVRAIEIGIFSLERARTGQDLEFVRRQVEGLMTSVRDVVQRIPGETEEALRSRVGTGDGQVLAPLLSLVNQVSQAASQKVREVQELLTQQIDPTKEDSGVGRALKSLRDMLDPERKDSIQGSISEVVKTLAAEGGMLSETVRKVVEQSVRPLANEVKSLTLEVRGQEAASEALEQTTAKGISFEEEVVKEVQGWCGMSSGEVHYVGTDNQPGDILVALPANREASAPLSILIEARDRTSPMGRKQITDCLERAMAERGANAGIYLSRDLAGLGKEIGDWGEGENGQGRWVACTHDHLITALRYLVMRKHVDVLKADSPEIDTAGIEAQVARIRTALERVRTINTRVTAVRDSADDIKAEADALRDDVRQALTSIEDAIRAAREAARANEAA